MYFHIQLKGNDNQLKDWNGCGDTPSIAKTKAAETFNVPLKNILFCKGIPAPKEERCPYCDINRAIRTAKRIINNIEQNPSKL